MESMCGQLAVLKQRHLGSRPYGGRLDSARAQAKRCDAKLQALAENMRP